MNHAHLNCDEALRVLAVCSGLQPLAQMPTVLVQAIHDRLVHNHPRLAAKLIRLRPGPLRSLASLVRQGLSAAQHARLSLPQLIRAVSMLLDGERDDEIADWQVETVDRITETVRSMVSVPVPA